VLFKCKQEVKYLKELKVLLNDSAQVLDYTTGATFSLSDGMNVVKVYSPFELKNPMPINFERYDGARPYSDYMGTYGTGDYDSTHAGLAIRIYRLRAYQLGKAGTLNLSFSITINGNTLNSGIVPVTVEASLAKNPENILPDEQGAEIFDELADHEDRITSAEGEIDTTQTDIVDLGDNKVDKLTAAGIWAYTHNGATQGEIAVSKTATADNIVQRDGQQIKGIAPVANEDYAIKNYVDTQDTATLSSAGSHADEVAAIAEISANSYTDITVADYVPLTQKGTAFGVCPLGADSKVLVSYLPSFVDDILEYPSFSALPTTGESGKLYVTLDTNLTYRWSGTQYTEVSKSLALGETSETAYRGDRGKIAYDNSNTLVSQMATVQANQARYSFSQIASNFDTITVDGPYTGYGTATGAPSTVYSWFITHENSNVNNNYATQKATAYSTDLIEYVRVKQSGAWGAWKNVSPFVWAEDTVSSNAFTADCTANTHYILTNTQDVALTIANAYNGATFEIKLYGGYAISDNTAWDVVNGYEYNTILDADTQYYYYKFEYDGTKWLYTRLVITERS